MTSGRGGRRRLGGALVTAWLLVVLSASPVGGQTAPPTTIGAPASPPPGQGGPIIDTLSGGPSLVERVIVRAPESGARLQALCFDVHRARCVSFTSLAAGPGPNPRLQQGVSFLVADARGAPLPQTQIVSGATTGGLESASLLDIRLPFGAPFVEVTMVSGRGGATSIEAFNTDGTSAGSAATVGRADRPDTVRVPRSPGLEIPQQPFGVSTFGDLVYVADPVNHVVRALDLRDTVPGCPCEAVMSGNGSVGAAAVGADPLTLELGGPYAVAVTPRPNGPPELAVADTFAHRVLRLGPPTPAPPGATPPPPSPTSVVGGLIGSGRLGFAGDGGQAPASNLNSPYGVARDAGRDILYVADTLNHRVRAVRSDGSITTVVGDGAPGAGGDGGPALAARLNGPRGLALDARGRLLIADTGNNAVRRFDPATGTITTVAGSGAAGFAGDGGRATLARLSAPSAVAVDSSDPGNVFIADTLNHRIRRVDGVTSIVTTIAGSGIAGFSGDDNTATAAQLDAPFGVAVRANGEVVIADTGNNRVRLVDAAQRIRTVAGNGTASYAGGIGSAIQTQLAGVSSIAVIATPVPSGRGGGPTTTTPNLLASLVDGVTGAVQALLSTTPTSSPPSPPVATTTTTAPAAGLSGALNGLANVVGGIFSPTTTTPAVSGSPAGGTTPTGPTTSIAPGPPTTVVAVLRGAAPPKVELRTILADPFNHAIREVDPQGQVRTLIGTGRPGPAGGDGTPAASTLNLPFGVALDRAASPTAIYVADTFNNMVRRIDRVTGSISVVAGDGTAGFAGDGGPANRARLSFPTAVTLDTAGNLYIADAYNARVRKVDTKGVITTVAGTGRLGFSGDAGPANRADLYFPYGVTADAATPANLYLADSFNHRIRRVDGRTGMITTVVGTGTPGRNGNGGLATAASLDRPWSVGLGVGPTPDLFVADTLNSRVQRVDGRTRNVETLTGGPDPGPNPGFRGDLGVAPAGFVSQPRGVAPIPEGPLMVADSFSSRARRIGLAVTGVDPDPVTFDSATRERTVRVTNNGKVTLAITETPIDGEHAGDFTIVANGCKGTKVPPGGSCTMRMTFNSPVNCPSTQACRHGRLSVAGNTSEGIRHVPLLGRNPQQSRLSTRSSPNVEDGPNAGRIGPGTPVTDTATVATIPTTPAPTGRVSFFLCGPTASATPCTTGGAPGGEKPLVNASAVSNPLSAGTAPGLYCWRAEYSGDTNYAPFTHSDTNRECFRVVLPSTVRTDSSPQIARGEPPELKPPELRTVGPGAMVTDRATVSAPAGGPVPTGTVRFHVCGPLTPNGPLLGTRNAVDPATTTSSTTTTTSPPGFGGGLFITMPPEPVRGPAPDACTQGGVLIGDSGLTDGSATSPPFVVRGLAAQGGPTRDGYYCWRADYLGDDNYSPSSHTDGLRECFHVRIPPPDPR